MTQEREPDVRGYAVTHPSGPVHAPRSPAWDELVHAVRGVLTVTTPDEAWVVPPHRAVWVPAGTRRRLVASGETALRTLYVRADLDLQRPPCRVIAVSPLLRELILECVRRAPLELARPDHARLLGVVLDQLREEPAARVAHVLLEHLSIGADVAGMAHAAGVSRRTLERSFVSQTGLGVASWHRRALMLEALRLLATGASASSVASRLGYATQSAFGAAFLREVGTTPARWAAPAGR